MGRLLLILLLVLVLLLWWKQRGRARPAPPPQPGEPQPQPEPMLRCAECGLHLPGSQALPGKGGVFCSAVHRSLHEARAEPPP